MILADTHAWLWWVGDRDALSPAARDAFSHDAIAVSPITFWEVAMLAGKGRVKLAEPTFEWLTAAVERSATTVLDLTLPIAATAGSFPDQHGDPADRIIVATAMTHHLPLVTKDRKIIASGAVRTIW